MLSNFTTIMWQLGMKDKVIAKTLLSTFSNSKVAVFKIRKGILKKKSNSTCSLSNLNNEIKATRQPNCFIIGYIVNT